MHALIKHTFLSLLMLLSLTCTGQLLDNYDISTSPNGVIPMPSGLGADYSSFVKYTKIQAPNGQAIHFIAQNALSDAQIVRARNILKFYLTNYSGSQYGNNKSIVMNKLGENNAILMLLNGSDQGNPPEIDAQPLYENEITVEGHAWYTTNDYDHRDATFEEILHLMHDFGIGVDYNGTPSPIGALPAYQTEIRAAQDNADNNNFEIWPSGQLSWYTELAQENSLSQEYLAAVIDSYYGLWEPWTGGGGTTGMWGFYLPKTREEIEIEDPMGYALIPKYFSPYIDINMDIDPSFTGVFNMSKTPSQPYTYKSQYLQHLTLTGSNPSGIKGNTLENTLNGNSVNNTLEGGKGDDHLDGKSGEDIAVFTGPRSEYSITAHTTYLEVKDLVSERDGTDQVINCETLQFSDQSIPTSSLIGVHAINGSKAISMTSNPELNQIQIEIKDPKIQSINLALIDLNGKTIQHSKHQSAVVQIDVDLIPKGVYILQIETNSGQQFIKKTIIQ